MPDTISPNQAALAAMQAARPVLVDIRRAGDAIPLLEKHTLLHAGPPVAWEHMVDVQRGAVVAAMLYEGWATSKEQAEQMAAAGEVYLVPCHDADAVGGMAGVTSPSMPVAVFQNASGKEQAFCRLWEPRLIFGNSDAQTIALLHWVEKGMGPMLKRALRHSGPIDLFSLIGRALQMGDECHSRLLAGSSIFLRTLLPYLLAAEGSGNDLTTTLNFLAANDGAFLTFIMGASKIIALAGSGVSHSTIITAICSNGYETGVWVSGAGRQWFTGPAPIVEGTLLPGFTQADASPQIGDSAINEVVGLGGCALAAAPLAPANIGGRFDHARAFSENAFAISVGQQPEWVIPVLGRGTALGLDAQLILDRKILPPLAATIPCKRAGGGRAGVGIARVPMFAFQQAVETVTARGHHE